MTKVAFLPNNTARKERKFPIQQQSVFCESPENATKSTKSYFGAGAGSLSVFV